MKKLLALTALVTLSACASIADGKNQSISITTDPSEAKCQLTNDKGTWYVPETPGSVTIQRSVQDVTVECKKDKLEGTVRAASTTKGMAFGNILFGGLPGMIIDRNNGSSFDYPLQIHVVMKKGGHFTQIGEHYEGDKKESEDTGAGNQRGIVPSNSVRNR